MSRSALFQETHHSAVPSGQGTPRVSAPEGMRVHPGSQHQTFVGFGKRLRESGVSDRGFYKGVS